MFCRRRRHTLLHLILALLGFRAFKECRMNPEEKEAVRTKHREFRSRLKNAFAVWEDEPAAAAPEGQQG